MIVGARVILFDPIFQGLAISLMAGEVASLLLSRMAASGTLPLPMRSIVVTFVLAVVWCDAAFAAGNDDWPCFLHEDGPRFVAALERDITMMRQGLVDKILGDLHADDLQCPHFDRAYALFRHDVTSLFDDTISEAIVLDRLRRRWKRRWAAAQCSEVAALRESGAGASRAPAPPPEERPLDVLRRWFESPEGTAASRDKQIAQRIKDTLTDIRDELAAIQRDGNARLRRDMPAVIRRDKEVAMAAIDTCTAAEEKRLKQAPDDSATPPATAPATVLSLDPPRPFIVTHEQNGAIAYLKITSSTGKPIGLHEDGSVCQASFFENPYGDRHTQADINERIVRPEEHERVLAPARAAMEIEPGKPFDRSGIRGMEFIAREKKPAASAPRQRVYMAMLETPKGYTFLRCATPDEGFAAALPQFRALRDSLNPPR